MLDREEKKAYDEKICASFLSSVTYRYASVLLLYAPLPDEVDIMPVAAHALANGKTVAFPRCIPAGDGKPSTLMEYRMVTALSDLRTGFFHIPEPADTLPLYRKDGAAATVCLIPGIVFDKDGYRVGYGKGYYDRYLVGYEGVRVGVTYTKFLLPRLPRGRFDVPCDVIVTEKGVCAVHAD